MKIKWADRIRKNEVFQRAKEERSLLKRSEKQTSLVDGAYN